MNRSIFDERPIALWLVLLVITAVSAATALGQNASLKSSSFSAGFGKSTGSGNTQLTSSSGEPFTGMAKGMNYQTESGFIPQVLELSSTQTTLGLTMVAGWNMVSVPLTVGNYKKTVVFPSGITNAFAYNGTYLAVQTLTNGPGYWVKFAAPQQVAMTGYERALDSVPLRQGWNMIGSLSQALSVSSLVTVPGGITTTQFYGYSGTYHTSTTIDPGKAYWVKTNQVGTLYLLSSSNAGRAGLRSLAGRAGKITIQESTELPPAPPDIASDPSPRIPSEFALYQNYPNPFNPSTTIHYDLPRSAQVRLVVINVLGQEVKVLVDEAEEAGQRSVAWDASALPSGVYFYRLTAGDFSSVRKMIVVK